MRAVEKAVVNNLILEGEKNLESMKEKFFGRRIYVPDAIEWMIQELEKLRKELEERTVEV